MVDFGQRSTLQTRHKRRYNIFILKLSLPAASMLMDHIDMSLKRLLLAQKAAGIFWCICVPDCGDPVKPSTSTMLSLQYWWMEIFVCKVPLWVAYSSGLNLCKTASNTTAHYICPFAIIRAIRIAAKLNIFRIFEFHGTHFDASLFKQTIQAKHWYN